MKTLLCLTLGFLCWTVFAGSAHAQAAASAGGGAAAASASAAPVIQQPVVVQQAVPFVVMQRSAFLATGGCGLGANVVGGGFGGASAAVAVGGGFGGGRIRGQRVNIRQRVRVR